MRIIPAIDIIDGKCVRLTKGDYSTKKVYNEDPLEVARQFEDSGVRYLHMVDLDGAKASHIVNHRILEKVAARTSLMIDFGGGLKSDNDIRIAFESGARQVTAGSIAVNYPDTFLNWLRGYGTEKIILGADVTNGMIAINGWTETSKKDLVPFIQEYEKEGIKYVICTDISKDGMLEGPAFELYEEILSSTKEIQLIASGGISKLSDLDKLKSLGCEGAIVGKAIYENKISMKELEHFILNS